MMFKAGYVLWFVSILRYGSGSKCEKDSCVAVPVIDHLAAPLTAQLDITELNKQIGEIIKERVKQEVENALKSAEEKLTSDIYNMVALNVRDLNETFKQQSTLLENGIRQEMFKLTQDSVKETSRLEDRIDRSLRQEILKLTQATVKETSRLEDRIDSYDRSLRQEILKLTQATVKVAVTSCLPSAKAYSNEVAKFSNVKLSVGISNVSLFTSTGIFTCEHAGLYLVSITLAVGSGKNGFIYILKNSNQFHKFNEGRVSGDSHTVTGMTSVMLDKNDKLSVKLNSNLIYAGGWSCATIIRIS